MKKTVLLLALSLLLSSCARYLKIEGNRFTRIYLPGLSYSGIFDSYDLYASEQNRFFYAGSRTYFFDYAYIDLNRRISPALRYLPKDSSEMTNVCVDPACVHNDRSGFTVRCILCDLSDYRYAPFRDGTLYFARARREDGAGGFFYDQSDGRDLSEASLVDFVEQGTWASADEQEVPWELIAYDLAAGTHEVLYSVPAEEYLDLVVYLDGRLFFLQTRYAERKNLIRSGEDYEWVYFTDTDSGEEGIRRPKRHFYTELTFAQDLAEYYRVTGAPEGGLGRHLVNLKYNRKYKLGDIGQLYEKVYDLMELDLKTKTVEPLLTELSSEPQELIAWDGMLYLADREGISSLRLDGGSAEPVRLLLYEKEGLDYRNIRDLQYDEIRRMLWFSCDGRLFSVLAHEDRGVFYPYMVMYGVLDSFQLTADGIYILQIDGSLVFVRWNELYSSKFKYVNNSIKVSFFTVLEDCVFISVIPEEGEKNYDFWRLKMEVEVTEQVSVSDPDVPGGGVLDYELTVIPSLLIPAALSDDPE